VRHSSDAEKFKLGSDGGDSGSKKRKPGHGSGTGGVWQDMHVAGVWSQAVGFVFVRWQDSGFSRHECDFIFNLLYK
jgi:hypothetical protein